MPAHRSTDSPTTAPNEDETHPRPSRLVPFLAFGSACAVLLAIAAGTMRNDDPVIADIGDYCCLGASLSGVTAAIFGTVTLSRAIRARVSGVTR